MVKKILIILCFVQAGLLFAQQGGNALSFSYDEAGNQIVRELICIGQGCIPKKTMNSIQTTESLIETSPKEMNWSKSSENRGLKYYPNPVQDDLYITWEDIQDDTVTQVFVYSGTGQFLKSFDLEGQTVQTVVNFSSYPKGMYQVILFFEKQEKQVLRIIKK